MTEEQASAQHRRNVSQPTRGASINLSQLERQWSTGDGLSINSFNTISTAAQDFHSTWTSFGATPSFDQASDPPRPPLQQITSPLPAPPSIHSPIIPSPLLSSRAISVDSLQLSSNHIDYDSNGTELLSIIHDEARVFAWSNVLRLCESQPQHAQYAGPDGWTALHHACNRRCDRTNVVEALVNAYPGALAMKEEKGMTPLHYACRFKAPYETVQLLLKPEEGHDAVTMRDRKGRTPLWYAVRYDAPPGVVQLLLQMDSSTVLEQDKTGESPLSLVWDAWAEKYDGKKTLAPFLNDPQPENIKDEFENLLKSNKKLRVIWETTHLFVKAHFGLSTFEDSAECDKPYRMLHATAAIPCHGTLFKMALALHPEHAMEFDDCVLTPGRKTALHLAASAESRTVITALLELNPDAAFVKDSLTGSLPLHCMVEKKKHWIHDGVRDVLQANPDAISEPDDNGCLPLHRAAAVHATGGGRGGSIILQLVEEYPEAASHADHSGRLPLHYSCMGDDWTEETEAIYRAHEAAIRTRDNDSMLPLHLAAASPRSTRLMMEKLTEYHARGARQTIRTRKLPLHLAVEAGKSWDTIEPLYAAYPGAIIDPVGQWVALQIASASPVVPQDVIAKLVDLYPEASTRVDDRGRCALHWACESGKLWGALEPLLHANPSANITEDKDGMLPFSLCALKYCHVDNEDDKKPPANDKPGHRRTNSNTGHVRTNSTGHSRANSTGHARTTSTGHARVTSTGHARVTSTGHARNISTGHGRNISSGHTRISSLGHARNISVGSAASGRPARSDSVTSEVAAGGASRQAEIDPEAAKLEVLYQLLMADPNILPSYV